MSKTKLEKLDRYLKIQTGRSDVLLGRSHVVFDLFHVHNQIGTTREILKTTDRKVRRASWRGPHCICRSFLSNSSSFGRKKALYMGNSVQWGWGALNAVTFLVKNHRFKDDPEYGELLEMIAKGEATRKDIETINSRVITGKKTP